MSLVTFTGPNRLWYPFDMRMLGASSVKLDMPGDEGLCTLMAFGGRVWFKERSGSKTIDLVSFQLEGTPIAGGEVLNLRVSLRDMNTGVLGPIASEGTNLEVIPNADSESDQWWTASLADSRVVDFGEEITIAFDISASAQDGDQVGIYAWKLADAGVGSSQPWVMYDETFGANACNGMVPLALFKFSDDTFGMIDGSIPGFAFDLTFGPLDDPNEYGLIFQVPWNCKVDALCAFGRFSGTAETRTTSLILSEANGDLIAEAEIDEAETRSNDGNNRLLTVPLDDEYELEKNTDYVVSMRPNNNADNATLSRFVLHEAGERVLFGGESLGQVSRGDGASWSAATTTLLPRLGVRISSVHATGAANTGQPMRRRWNWSQHHGGKVRAGAIGDWG